MLIVHQRIFAKTQFSTFLLSLFIPLTPSPNRLILFPLISTLLHSTALTCNIFESLFPFPQLDPKPLVPTVTLHLYPSLPPSSVSTSFTHSFYHSPTMPLSFSQNVHLFADRLGNSPQNLLSLHYYFHLYFPRRLCKSSSSSIHASHSMPYDSSSFALLE